MKLSDIIVLEQTQHKYNTHNKTNEERPVSSKRAKRRDKFEWQSKKQAQAEMIDDLWLYANADAT